MRALRQARAEPSPYVHAWAIGSGLTGDVAPVPGSRQIDDGPLAHLTAQSWQAGMAGHRGKQHV